LSFIPIIFFATNAQALFKKTGVKEISKHRRERLDKEYGIDRDNMTGDFEKLDKIYRVSEKVEIEKYNRLGKSSKEYMEMKEMKQESDEQKDLEQAKPKMSAAEYFKQKKTNEGL
jgi:hypothetical protein